MRQKSRANLRTTMRLRVSPVCFSLQLVRLQSYHPCLHSCTLLQMIWSAATSLKICNKQCMKVSTGMTDIVSYWVSRLFFRHRRKVPKCCSPHKCYFEDACTSPMNCCHGFCLFCAKNIPKADARKQHYAWFSIRPETIPQLIKHKRNIKYV